MVFTACTHGGGTLCIAQPQNRLLTIFCQHIGNGSTKTATTKYNYFYCLHEFLHHSSSVLLGNTSAANNADGGNITVLVTLVRPDDNPLKPSADGTTGFSLSSYATVIGD